MFPTPHMQIFLALARLKKLIEQQGRPAEGVNDTSYGFLKKGMAAAQVFLDFPHAKQKLTQGTKGDIILLMVDLSPFSAITQNWGAEDVRDFLQEYYDYACDLIDKAGGVVERFDGDAIIAIFGPPFDNETHVADLLSKVIAVSKKLVVKTYDCFSGEVSAKCAIASGICFLGWMGHKSHKELTVVGTPLTVLSRLEDKSKANEIIMLDSLFDVVRDRWVFVEPGELGFGDCEWSIDTRAEILRGVGDQVPIVVLRYNHS